MGPCGDLRKIQATFRVEYTSGNNNPIGSPFISAHEHPSNEEPLIRDGRKGYAPNFRLVA